MKYVCLACGKESDDKKDFFEVSGNVGPRKLCKTCAAEVGIKNIMSAGFTTNTAVLKKYVELHPEAKDRLTQQLDLKKEAKAEQKAELKQMAANAMKHSGCKKVKQTKCICNSCGNTFYFSDTDKIKNAANLLMGNAYTLNQVKNLAKCPKCGSEAVSKKDVFFWVDKKGNCVDIEE